jgi:cell division protein FtsL
MLDALLAGRGWIALVFLLLVGIVFFNIGLLQLNREIALTTEKASHVKRTNAQLRLELARLGSSERLQRVAAAEGFVLPAPGEVRYLSAAPGPDALRAAERITEPTDLPAPAPIPSDDPAEVVAPTEAEPTPEVVPQGPTPVPTVPEAPVTPPVAEQPPPPVEATGAPAAPPG